ncbi:MAG TPA: hypothetical protein PLY68_01690 [Myxococcota bacterium]|nr:hypothetical protein [Myxococcota bacterium]HOD07037.1 hypothetical protein [Myxococcota bacterium]HPB49642.1 hypothetical protein [Myxococcota bacterium]HQP94890.1 hypothetical protein [Myxococcota bacterium]
MKRFLLPATCLFVGVIGGCVQPCEKLADMTCLAHGGTSAECVESRQYAKYAGHDDKEKCRAAMTVIDSLSVGNTQPR